MCGSLGTRDQLPPLGGAGEPAAGEIRGGCRLLVERRQIGGERPRARLGLRLQERLPSRPDQLRGTAPRLERASLGAGRQQPRVGVAWGNRANLHSHSNRPPRYVRQPAFASQELTVIRWRNW